MEIGDAVDPTDIYVCRDVHWVRVMCYFDADEREEMKTEDDFVWREEDDWRILTLEEMGKQILDCAFAYVWVEDALEGHMYRFYPGCGWILHGKTMGYA